MLQKSKKNYYMFCKILLSYGILFKKNRVIMPQYFFSVYLDLTTKTIQRYFAKARKNNLVTVVGKMACENKNKCRPNGDNFVYFNLVHDIDVDSVHDEMMSIDTEVDPLKDLDDLKAFFKEFNDKVDKYYFETYGTYRNWSISNKNLKELKEIDTTSENISKKTKNKIAKTIDRISKINKHKETYSEFLDILKSLKNIDKVNTRYLEEGSMRLTNSICSTNNPNKSNKKRKTQSRYKLISQYFGVDENTKFEEFDTNASISRVSYSLGNKKLFDSDLDIYETVYNMCGFDTTKWDSEMRKQFKQLFMPTYMMEYNTNYKQSLHNVRKTWKNIFDKKDREEFYFYKYFEDALNLNIRDILNLYKENLHKFFNLDTFYRGEVFIHESNLHILMLKKFEELNIKTVNVYDAFYFVEGEMTQELYNSIYNECTLELIKMYDKINEKDFVNEQLAS